MGRRRQRRRRLASATFSSAGDVKINDASSLKKWKTNDASAMLLYQSPSGVTVLSFDGGYLNDPVKDFWACLPPLSLKLSIKYEKVPTPINLVNEDIDSFLHTRLTELRGSEKKLVVGSAEYERIIGKKLGINCLYVEVPDCEVIIRSLKNPMQSVKINDALALLLYQAPSGIAIFCFDGGHLNDSVEDFWACLPQLSLIVFIKKEVMPIPIDPATEDIDGRLVKTLRKLCRSGRKLVVGSAEYKRIIETKLGIKDCEVIICSMNKPKCALLPEQQSEPTEDLELFLHQHGFDVKLKMVDDTSLKEAAYLLHDTELCENEYLKFFRLLLKDFMVTSEIDTKRWVLIHFATALKMICHPGASYEVYSPVKLFSFGEVQKIEAHAPGYRRSFSRIDVLSVYEDVVSLVSKKCVLMFKLDIRVKKAKRVLENADVRSSKYHSPGKLYISTGSKVGKEASTNVDGRLNSIAQDNCIEVNLVNHSDLDFSCERQEQDVEQILTIPEINSSMEKPNRLCDEENCNKENDPGQQVMSNQTISAGGQHYLVLDDDIPATKIVASSRLDSRPSKQEEIPGTISGRLMDLVAMEVEREEMEAKFENLGLSLRWLTCKGDAPSASSPIFQCWSEFSCQDVSRQCLPEDPKH